MEGMRREVASACAWLDLVQVQELARLLLTGDLSLAGERVAQWVPELADCDLRDPVWSEAFLDELEWRLAPGDDEDPDQVATREIPDYTRFAHVLEP